MEVDTGKSFQESSAMKHMARRGQGTDAALEQVIKRSKKGVKIKVVLLEDLSYIILPITAYG